MVPRLPPVADGRAGRGDYPRVTVTIYTDASIKVGRGAWACVILREGEPMLEASGPLKGEFRSSTATELCAIANALHHAEKVQAIGGARDVVIWCDNEAAVWRVNGRGKVRGVDPMLLKVGGWIARWAGRNGVRIAARHIKGHQRLDSDDPGAIYNLRCDGLCSAVRDQVEPTSFDVLIDKVAKARARKAAGQGSRRERDLWAAE